MKCEIVKTRSKSTVKVTTETDVYYLHSKYDPVSEANKWVSGIKSNKLEQSNLVVIGMGAGHHIRALLNITNAQKITVFEFNDYYYQWVLHCGLIDDLLLDNRIIYKLPSDGEKLRDFAMTLNENLIIYQPSLKIFSSKYKEIKEKLENYIVQERTVNIENEQFYYNFEQNNKLMDYGLSEYKNPESTSMILVSAGPSLTKQLPLLKSASKSGQYVIGAVGTAFRPLMSYGIVPNFVMISDTREGMVRQFQGYETNQTTLFYLCTANHEAVSSFQGPRFIVWQKGVELAEKRALEKSEPLIRTGGSVATCLLDLMVYLGARKIALVGQDLAYTNGQSHAVHTPATRKVTSTMYLREIPNYYQDGIVYTSKGLSIFLDWFKQYVIGKNKIEFWNCTEGGAYIENWIHQPLKDYIKDSLL